MGKVKLGGNEETSIVNQTNSSYSLVLQLRIDDHLDSNAIRKNAPTGEIPSLPFAWHQLRGLRSSTARDRSLQHTIDL